MKQILFISICLFLVGFHPFSQNRIILGKYTYYKSKVSKSVEKVNNGLLLYSTWVRYRLKGKDIGFICVNTSTRNDSVFRRGYFHVDKKNRLVICTEVYFFEEKANRDSSHKYFKQLKNGAFTVIKYSEFKDGEEKIKYTITATKKNRNSVMFQSKSNK